MLSRGDGSVVCWGCYYHGVQDPVDPVVGCSNCQLHDAEGQMPELDKKICAGLSNAQLKGLDFFLVHHGTIVYLKFSDMTCLFLFFVCFCLGIL